MKRAARILVKSKFFISPLNISVQMTQQQQRKFQLKSARCLSPVCKCELHSLHRVHFNYSSEVVSVKGDFPYRNLLKSRSSTQMEKSSHHVSCSKTTRLSCTETSEIPHVCFRQSERAQNEGDERVFSSSLWL